MRVSSSGGLRGLLVTSKRVTMLLMPDKSCLFITSEINKHESTDPLGILKLNLKNIVWKVDHLKTAHTTGNM